MFLLGSYGFARYVVGTNNTFNRLRNTRPESQTPTPTISKQSSDIPSQKVAPTKTHPNGTLKKEGQGERPVRKVTFAENLELSANSSSIVSYEEFQDGDAMTKEEVKTPLQEFKEKIKVFESNSVFHKMLMSLYENDDSLITKINLSGCNIGDEGAKALAEALKVNQKITSINLSDCNIGDEGAKALAEALKVNQKITSINLSGCNIGDAGATALAEALKVNKSLKAITLTENNIGDEGATALAEALNRTITINLVDNNNIRDAGATALEEKKTQYPHNVIFDSPSIENSHSLFSFLTCCTNKQNI